MKKILLAAVILLGSIYSIKAQTVYFQDFQASGTNAPSGWTTGVASYHPKNQGWKFNDVFPTHGNSLWLNNTATHTYCAFVDDVDYNYTGSSWNNTTGIADYDTLYTTSINCSTASHVFMTFDLNFNNYTGYEVGTLIVSTNGGSTWTKITDLPSQSGSLAWQDSLVADISSFTAGQANVELAFTWNNAGAVSHYGAPGWGMAIDNLDVYAPLGYDLSVTAQNLSPLMQAGTAYTFTGSIYNYGGDSIKSMTMNYAVNGNVGSPATQTFTLTPTFNSLTSYDWSMSAAQFTPPSAGTYTVKFWADNLNGSYIDQNHANDTLTANFWVLPSLKPRQALYEEFTGQSCVYCMLAGPNMDSVQTNNATTSNIIRYHVPIPGRDFMYGDGNGANTGTWVNPRMTYYSVDAAPTGFLDGTSLEPSGLDPDSATRYSSHTLQADDNVGSPFTIDITSAGFDAAKDSFYVSGSITAYAAFTSGLKLQVALTIDSLTYPQDLSTDNPQGEFQPPIGSTSGNSGVPDTYFPYVLKFPHVLEYMFPSASGTSLAAFTSGQQQPFTFGWKQNHPWGEYPNGSHALGDSTDYHASSTGQIVVFVQTNNSIPADFLPAKYVFQSASAPFSGMVYTGMQKLSDGVLFEMYPNPTNNNTNIKFQLDKDQNINVAVYNMLGEQVYSTNQGNMPAGTHTITIDGSNLQNGMYFVRIITDNVTTTKKLIIQR